MAGEFNADEYFNSRIKALGGSEPTLGAPDKAASLEEAGQKKIAHLEQLASKRKAQVEASSNSLVTNLGLDPDGVIAPLINVPARALAGASKNVIGQLLALPSDVLAAGQMGGVDDADMEAYARHTQGVATPEDLQRLNSPNNFYRPGQNVPGAKTKLDLLQSADQSRDVAKGARELFNIDYLTHKDNTDALTNQLKDGFQGNWDRVKDGWSKVTDGKGTPEGLGEIASGLGGLIFNAGEAAVDNPMAATEYVAENLPQLLVGMGGKAGQTLLTATNAGYAFENYNEGIANYRAKNAGAFPPPEERQRMAAYAASLALAEQLGDVVQLKGITPAKEAVRTGFTRSVLNVGKETGLAGATEAATEGYQTFAEGEVTGKPASAEDIYVGAAIGGITGGLTTGGIRAGAEAAQATPEHAKERAQEASKQEVLAAAVASGDVSALTDPKNAAYAPEKAVAALFANSQAEGATPEAKQANLEKAASVVSDLETERAKVQAQYDEISPETAARNQAKLDEWKTKLAAATDAGEKAKAQEAVDLLTELVQSQQAPDEKALRSLTAKLSKADRQLDAARTGLTAFQQAQVKDVDVDADVASINTPASPEAATAAAERVITLSMAAPERLDAKVAAELADNASNGLTESQRTYLRAFSAARQAENELMTQGEVSQRVFTGNGRDVGIAQYRTRVTQALSAGNQVQADRHMKDLANFEADHKAKAALALKAEAEVARTGKEVQVLRKKDRAWFINRDTPLSRTEVKKNGGLSIHPGTPKSLVPGVQAEAKALTAALAELQSAYAVKFPNGGSNVQVVPKKGEAVEAQDTGGADQEAKAVGGDAKAPAAVPAARGSRPAVEAVRLKVFHGSDRPISPRKGEAIYVTTNRAYAESFNPLNKGELSEYDLTLENPYYVDAPGEIDGIKYSKSVMAKLKADGHDGVIFRGGKGQPQQALVFDAGQLARESQKTESTEKTSVDSGDSVATVAQSSTSDESQAPSVESKESTTGSEVQTAPERAIEPAEQASKESEPAQSAGVLSIFAQKSAEDTDFRIRNLIADFFTQTAQKIGDSTARPLVAVKDFLTQGYSKALEYVQFEKLDDNQDMVLRHFEEKAKDWAGKIRENLSKKKSEAFRFEDMMQYLLVEGEKGLDLDENLKTAIAYAAYSWVAENAARTPFNTDGDINQILGRDEDEQVSSRERALLVNVGTRQNVVVNSLGQRAAQAAGLKASKAAPADLMPRLESALGAHAMKLLMDEGILVRSTVPGEVFAELTGSSSTNVDASQFFLKVTDEMGLVHPEAQKIYETSQGTQGVLDKLFGVESGLKEPSLTPVPFNQATTRNTNQAIPKKLAEIVAAKNAEANYVRQDMWQLVTQLDENIALEMAGFVSVSDDQTHAAKRDSIIAKNDGLRRELTRFKAYVGGFLQNQADGLDTPIYFEHSVWKQQRVGIATNAVNPQSSKIHRHMLFRKAWETKVDRNDSAMVDNFRLRVLEGLGVKTDKQANQKSLAQWEAKSKEPAIAAAVEVLRKSVFEGGITTEEQKTLLAGVKAGGENFHSLDALMALAQEAQAKKEGKNSFTVQLMGEVDGVTNGPMLTHLLLGAASSVEELFELLNKGGFFEEGNADSQYNIWRGKPGQLDLYETTALHMTEAVQGMLRKDSSLEPILTALYAFTGTLADKDGKVQKAGRNIVKTPLTAMVFGSAVGKAIDSMSDGFIESIYAAIEDTSRGVQGAMTREQLIAHLNTLGVQLKADTNLMELVFNRGQRHALKESFKGSLGKAVEATMKRDFGVFMGQRRTFNLAAQTAFALFNAVYTGMREAYIDELVAQGDIAVGSKGEPIHDLTSAQEQELQRRLSDMQPVMHTLMSKDSGSLRAGLRLAKSARKLSQRGTFKGVVGFGKPFGDNNAKSTTTHGYETSEADPGAAAAVMSIHSTDSAISHYAAALGEVLNIHDAHGAGLATFEETARNLNQATWNAMLDYSPASEVFQALSRTVMGLASVLESDVPSQVRENLTKALDKMAEKMEISPDAVIDTVLNRAKEMAYQADDMKLQALGQMQSVDQYALEGGSYEVTEADRAAAAARRAELTQAISPEEKKALDQIAKALSPSKKEAKLEADPEIDAPVQEIAPPRFSPFGELGESPIDSDPRLVNAFEAQPVMSGMEALRLAYSAMRSGQSPAMKEFYGTLIQRLSKSMPKDLTVTYITSKTEFDRVVATPQVNSRGWYVSTTQGRIYVLSPEFKASGLTGEMLLHELLHGVMQKAIDGAATGSPEAALVKDLEVLRAKAEEFVEAMPEDEKWKYEPAVGDVHELVSWGLSNAEFQENVLKKITLQSKTKKNDLVTGLKSFINTLVEFIFAGSDKSKQQQHYTGMATLISNVSGLLASIEDNSAPEATGRVSSMAAAQLFSTLDIHSALNGTSSTGFDTHLRNLLGGIVEKLHGPFGTFKASMQANQSATPLDAWMKARDTGAAPFASLVLASPLQVSEQEAHAIEQVEATVRAALSDKSLTTMAYAELSKLYTEAEQKLKGTLAPDVYAFVFGIQKSAGDKSDYLARFAALALAHEGINQALKFDTDRSAAAAPRTIADRVQGIFEKILAFFSEKVTGTYRGQQADAKLQMLVGQLVDIEAKKRYTISRRASAFDPFTPVEELGRKATDSLRKGVSKAARSRFVRNSTSGVVQGVGALARTWSEDRVDQFLEVLNDWRNREFKGRQGIVAGLLQEVRGPAVNWQQNLREAKKALEQERKRQITVSAKMALEAFENNGKDLSKDEKAAISAVFLRLGTHNLLDHFSMTELEQLLSDPNALQTAIDRFESQLNGLPRFKPYFIEQANALGYFRATGRVKNEVMMMNAHNIARMYGTPYESRITEAQAQGVEGAIKALITLYGLDYSKDHKARAKSILASENQRAGGQNGVEFVLRLHRQMEADSLARNFGGRPALMMHGYTPEIYNPHTEIKTATDVVGEELVAMGYTRGELVDVDPVDPDLEPKRIYVLKDGGLQPMLTGIVSYTGKNAKGTKKHSGYMNVNTADGLMNASMQADITNDKQQAVPGMFRAGPRRDLRKAQHTFMAPVLNESGELVNWRYLMQEETKDLILERTNDFDQILGSLAGSIYDKETTQAQNEKTVQALYDQYQADVAAGRIDGYVMVGPNSPDPKLREIWALLPDDTRTDVRAIWGVDSMLVKSEILDIVFGYRKFSLSEAFKKDPGARGEVEKHFVGFIEHLYGVYARGRLGMNQADAEKYAKRAAVHAAKSERVWQEIVRETKDIIVVKTGIVMLGNIWSNFSLLALSGVSVKDMLQTSLVALKGATAYQQDNEELSRLQGLLATGYTQGRDAEIQRQILRLEDALARNPVKELIDAGLMPTIVEDVGAEQDPYSYKSLLARKTERFTDQLNPNVVKAGKLVYMAKDTAMYQGLSRITQLSDFVARYTLYQHLVNRRKNPLSKAAAIQEASDSFVNYDIPMHRGLQYTDDMGITMFTKYFLRIQRVLLKLSRDNPVRVLLAVALNNYLDLGPIVLDSSALTRIGNNPLEWGAFQFPGTLDELATVQAGMSLIK